MLIEICKKTQHACEYSITRDDTTQEHFTLETKTYFLHDICHYVVEKQLQFNKGFWGMLSIGHSLQELFGKENPLTPELRFIEQIVGPIQSVYAGHLPKQQFSQFINHLNFEISDLVLNNCLEEIATIQNHWRNLEIGKSITLTWTL